jgi:hypothetical protein
MVFNLLGNQTPRIYAAFVHITLFIDFIVSQFFYLQLNQVNTLVPLINVANTNSFAVNHI